MTLQYTLTKHFASWPLQLLSFGLLVSITSILIIFSIASNVYSIDITLAWDKNTETDLAGYRIFCREEGFDYDYHSPAWEGTGTTCTIEGLDASTIYYFVARAFDLLGNESDNSNELIYLPDLPVTNQPPKADAGPDQTVKENVQVILKGSNSFDPDGYITGYLWTQISGPTVKLSRPNRSWLSFTAPPAGSQPLFLTFQLEVTDNGGLHSADTCVVNIESSYIPSTLIGLSMNGPSSVNENSMAGYIATASYSDGNTQIVTEMANWMTESIYALMNMNGTLLTFDVESDKIITITATFTSGNVIETVEKMVTIVNIPKTNEPPFKPVIDSPFDGQTGCDLMLSMTTLPFSDPEIDIHSQTQWQISKHPDFSLLILDITSIDHLTELTGPHLVLEDKTTYIARVRFFDDNLNVSEWSNPIKFTTLTNHDDLNENGIPDDQEVGGYIDINKDSINDNEQPEMIKSIQTDDDHVIITLLKDSDSVLEIEALETTDLSTISEMNKKPKKFILSLFAYRIRVDTFGAPASMRIIFSENISMAKYFYKYDTIHGWEDYSKYVYFDYPDKSITIQLLDGGHGDSDGVANGIIIDPGGLVSSVNQAPIAIARAKQSVNEGELVTLDATESMDPDGHIASYSWSQRGGTMVILSDPSAAQTTFIAPSADVKEELLTFHLKATDNDGFVDTDTVIIRVSENRNINTVDVFQSNHGGCYISASELSN